MDKIKLARRFALAGFLISIAFYLFWKAEDKFNFFHLPTADTEVTGNYTQPTSRALLEKLNFAFCPPLLVTSFAGMDLSAAANKRLWLISLVSNTILYFLVGLIVASLRDKLVDARKTPRS
jgi:predicted permease